MFGFQPKVIYHEKFLMVFCNSSMETYELCLTLCCIVMLSYQLLECSVYNLFLLYLNTSRTLSKGSVYLAMKVQNLLKFVVRGTLNQTATAF